MLWNKKHQGEELFQPHFRKFVTTSVVSEKAREMEKRKLLTPATLRRFELWIIFRGPRDGVCSRVAGAEEGQFP